MKYTRLTAIAALLGNIITLLTSAFCFFFSDSAALLYSVFISISGIVCSLLTLLVIRQKAKGSNSKFSYGTNRLENFNALSMALVMFICVIVAVASAIRSIINDEHVLMNFLSIPISLMVGGVTQTAIYGISKRGLKYENSPILMILSNDAKVGTIRNLVSFFLVVILWLFSINNQNYHFWIDKVLAFSFALFGSYFYLSQIYKDFKALSDFPLEEQEQLFILKILSTHFSKYENIRTIFTATKGNNYIVEVELLFAIETPLKEVIKLQDDMAADFKKKYKNGQFKINILQEAAKVS
jgi:divalent metal cation (Fe/Co/Zn/Cd) transporter